MSDQGQGQFRGETWETKSDTPSPTPFPGTTSPSPVQRNADALGAATPTTHATPTALSPPSNVGETREGAAGESNTSTSQSGTNHNDGTTSVSPDVQETPNALAAMKSTVASAPHEPHGKQHRGERAGEILETVSEITGEFLENVGELVVDHIVEHAVKHAVSGDVSDPCWLCSFVFPCRRGPNLGVHRVFRFTLSSPSS